MPPPEAREAHEVPETRITGIAAGLAAVGLTPELKEYADHTSVEAAVPGTFSDDAWPEVLALLETADSFGLADSSARGRLLWAAIRKGAPAATDGPGSRVQP